MMTAIVILLILAYLYGGLYMLHVLGTDHIYDDRTTAYGSFFALFFLLFWLPIMIVVYIIMSAKGLL